MRLTALLFLFVFTGVLISAGDADAQSVGFFPSTIELNDALRGQDYQTRTTLVNQASESRIFTLKASGDTAGWTAFALPESPDEAVDQVTVPAQSEVEILVTVTVPQSAPNGDISGKNTFDGYTEDSFANREGLVTGFEQPVRVKVTGDQMIDLRVGDVTARDVEVGRPLTITAQLTNQGNVDTAPQLSVDIFRLPGDSTDAPLDTISADLDAVPPGQSRTGSAEWDTTGRAEGRYRADYAVTLDGDRLGLGSFEFELQPPGSILPEGAIVSVDLVKPLTPGTVNRADVTFENTGDVEVRAQFTGHLYKDAAALSEAATPDYLNVAPGERVVLSAYFDLPKGNAVYELRGRAYFEGAETEEIAVPFAIGGTGEPTVTRWLAIGGGAFVGLGALVMGAAWAMRRRPV